MGIFFIDESGYHGNYIFAAIEIDNPEIPKTLIGKWRKWRKYSKINYEINEYHDTNVTDKERKKMLSLISKNNEIKLWGVQINNYDDTTIEAHIGAVIKLLKYAGIKEDDAVIIDKPTIKNKQIERYKQKVKKGLGMKKLNISLDKSEKVKGIQIADAVAGSLSRKFIPRDGKEPYFDLIASKLAKDVIKI